MSRQYSKVEKRRGPEYVDRLIHEDAALMIAIRRTKRNQVAHTSWAAYVDWLDFYLESELRCRVGVG